MAIRQSLAVSMETLLSSHMYRKAQSDRQNGGCVIVGNGKMRREGGTRNVEPIGITREKSWYIWVFVRKMVMWLFKIFEIQKGRTFSFNDILRLCTIVIIIATRSRA